MSNDGGQAFPTSDVYTNPRSDRVETTINDGMSLRDYFAAKWMAALCLDKSLDCGVDEYELVIARSSYAMADAMLAEREKSK